MTTPSLTAEEIATTMKAMVAVILQRRPSTRDVGDTMPIAVVGGEQVYGADAADRLLVEALAANPEGWAAWLADPAHVKPATSMVVALDATLLARLDATGTAEPVLAALDRIGADIAGARALARRNAGQRGEEPVIDLREGQHAQASA